MLHVTVMMIQNSELRVVKEIHTYYISVLAYFIKKILCNSKQVRDDLGDQWFGYFLAK